MLVAMTDTRGPAAWPAGCVVPTADRGGTEVGCVVCPQATAANKTNDCNIACFLRIPFQPGHRSAPTVWVFSRI